MKVIDIMTGEALESLPFDREQAAEILKVLIFYKDGQMPFSEINMIRSLMKFVESNSGVLVSEVIETIEQRSI